LDLSNYIQNTKKIENESKLEKEIGKKIFSKILKMNFSKKKTKK